MSDGIGTKLSMRLFRVISAALLMTLLFSGVSIAKLPAWSLWKDGQAIREALLAETPFGSSFDEVLGRMRADGYDAVASDKGFYEQAIGEEPHGVGETSIEVTLGSYGLIFKTDVTAYWGFDAEGKLIDLWVWKVTDAL